MTVRPNTAQDVADYLAAVSAALEDLPQDEREDLLVEVEASLTEAAADTDGPIAARLGPPAEFAAELRAAAGLERARSTRVSALRAALLELAEHPRVVALRPTFERLAPLWWALRGYVALAALALALNVPWSFAYPPVPRFGGGEVGLVLVALAVVASILIGLRGRTSAFSLAANAAVALAAVPVAVHLADRPPPQLYVAYVPVPSAVSPGLSYDGVPVRNVYPVTRDGRLLHDVLLYNEAGAPLEIGRDEPDPAKRIVITNQAEQIFNAFPIRYFEPGTRRVAHPDAMPRIHVPRIVTPRLKPS